MTMPQELVLCRKRKDLDSAAQEVPMAVTAAVLSEQLTSSAVVEVMLSDVVKDRAGQECAHVVSVGQALADVGGRDL